jgi:protoheme IX farnesyltransferase
VKNASLDRPVAIEFPIIPTSERHKLADYVTLAKPRLNLLVVATSVVGFFAASNRPTDLLALLHTAIGSALVASGAAAWNQICERRTDALMDRTRMRPLPGGRLSVAEARVFSVSASLVGLLELAFGVNLLSAMVALVTLLVYGWVYTPMKLRTPAATLVGAIPGALPPLIGWAGARGTLSLDAWTLFAIVFCWQIPHFLAIAWMYREDYRRAGFPMLPVIESNGRRTGRQAALFAAMLVLAAVSPYVLGLTGPIYLVGSLVLSLALLGLAVRFARVRSDARARTLFFGSLVYLPVLWTLLLIDRA